MTELFLNIVNRGIAVSWLLLAVMLLRPVLRKAPKWIAVLLWGLAGIRLICPFAFESALSLVPSAETVRPEIMMSARPSIESGIPAVDQIVNPVIGHSFAPDAGASVNPLQIWIPLLAAIWCAGMAALLIYMSASCLRLHRKVRMAVRLQKNIYQCGNIDLPFILGIVRPKIYIPFSLSEDVMGPVLSHERAHLRRRDHWWKLIGFLLLAVYWFHPLMWVSYILLCRDIEFACDEKVIRNLGEKERADYTQALFRLSLGRSRMLSCPLAFGEVGVKERVKSILYYRKPAFWMLAAGGIACIAVTVCFLTNPHKEEAFGELDGISAVLKGDTPFIYCSDGGEKILTIEDVPSIFDEDDLYMRIWQFSVVDLDADGEEEVVLSVSGASGDMGGKLILHRMDGRVLGYSSSYREFESLKEDGTYQYSDPTGAAETGICAIRSFSEAGYSIDKITYAIGSYERTDTFTVSHRTASEAEYEEAMRKQDEKADAVWHDFTAENLDIIF